jgi:hypothetical protein
LLKNARDVADKRYKANKHGKHGNKCFFLIMHHGISPEVKVAHGMREHPT